VTLRAQESATYRWEVFSTPSAEGSVSEPLEVQVLPPAPAPPEPTEPASDATSTDEPTPAG
jgi:hypothetical protein